MDNQLERRFFDFGWLIGIIDGEGCFHLQIKRQKGRTSFYPMIQITNTNLEIIHKAKDILAGNSVTCHIETKFPKKGKLFYRLEICGVKRLRRFFDIFYKYFECRFTQATLLKEYVDLRLSKPEHAQITDDEHSIASLLRQENQKGRSSETERDRS